ncbi:MAG TPA: AraC family transcriptional regulator [Salinimicrobium sp.]|nr:AraC family transcriptional regulator [Salinimicrobium sp.]
MGSFYFLLSVYTLQTYIVDGGNLDKYTWFFLWPLIPYNFFFVPIYYYFQIIFRDELKWKKRQILLFIPLFLAVIDATYIYLQPDSVYNHILNDAIVNPLNRLDADYWLLTLNEHVLIRHLWQFGILLVLLPQLLRFIKLGKEDRLKRILNKWLVLFWTILTIFGILAMFYAIEKMTGTKIFPPLLDSGEGGSIVTLTLYLALLVIGIVPIYFPTILHGYPQITKMTSISKKQVENNNEPDLKFGLEEQEIKMKLELLNQKKLYLDQSFDLTRCAREMQMPAHHISYFLKSHFGLSFSSYKNNLRMDYAKTLIETGFLENNTIEALAEKCGFASRSSFSKAFKNATDSSPSQYAQNIQ